MKTKIEFKDFPEEHKVSCIIKYNNKEFIGEANCHPEDEEYFSTRTGGVIAEVRAKIKLFKYKEKELKNKLRVLKSFEKDLLGSKANPKSYECKRLKSKIKNIELDIQQISNIIYLEEQYLFEYIENKNIIFNKYKAKKN